MILAAVIVTHDRCAMLARSVTAILAQDLDHLLVVDNASEDGTADWLARQTDPRLLILRLPKNTGGAGGFAAGMAWLRDRVDPDWTLLLDDDAAPENGAINAFLRRVDCLDPVLPERSSTGMIAAAVFSPDGRICEMNRPALNPFWHLRQLCDTLRFGGRKGFHLADRAFAADASPVSIDTASFVGAFISRDAVRKVGLPDPDLFIYGDDVLYCLALRRAGACILFDPAIRFVHDCRTLSAGAAYRPLWKAYYHCRNGVFIARQAAGPVLFPMALVWYIILWTRRRPFYSFSERRMYDRYMWTGILHGLLGRKGIWSTSIRTHYSEIALSEDASNQYPPNGAARTRKPMSQAKLLQHR